jgi:predicted metalloprotease with PDZ domain
MGIRFGEDLLVSEVHELSVAHRGGVAVGCRIVLVDGIVASWENASSSKAPCKIRFEAPFVVRYPTFISCTSFCHRH